MIDELEAQSNGEPTMADRLMERVNADIETLKMDAWLFSIADGSIPTTFNSDTYFDSLQSRLDGEVYPTILQI